MVERGYADRFALYRWVELRWVLLLLLSIKPVGGCGVYGLTVVCDCDE